jgi:hypothetical protein
MIEKAGRVSTKWLRFIGKGAEEQARETAQKRMKVIESWKAISHTEFARYFIEKCQDIKDSAYIKMTNLSLSNLDEMDGDNLKSIIRAMQQRVVVIDELLATFIPDQSQIDMLKEETQKEE